jgi:hypothetical protein
MARVRYFDRQFLRVEDFADEQAYQVAMRRRHNIAQHSWGIVEGLTITFDDTGLYVQPGYAIDGYGREIVLAQRQGLEPQEFDRQRSETLDVWIVYDRQDSNPAPPGYAGCGQAGQPSRSPETPAIQMEKHDFSYPDPRQPKDVSPGDLSFPPMRIPPDSPNKQWPVFLGQVTRTGATPPYIVSPTGRPYAGLVGESLEAPSGETRLQIGQGEQPGDTPGFAVFLPAVEQQKQGASLQIDNLNQITLRGDTTVTGDVILTSGALEFPVAAPAPPPKAAGIKMAEEAAAEAQPWKIYVAPNSKGGTDLRIEMAAETGTPNRVAIGAFSADDKKFSPCLTVDEDCTVTVEKDLRVGGAIRNIDGGVPRIVTNGLTQEAQEFLLGSLMSGVAGAGAVLGRFFQAPAPSPADVADFFAADPDQAVALIHMVKRNNPGLFKRIRHAVLE